MSSARILPNQTPRLVVGTLSVGISAIAIWRLLETSPQVRGPAGIGTAMLWTLLTLVLGAASLPGALGALIQWQTEDGLSYWAIISLLLLIPATAIATFGCPF